MEPYNPNLPFITIVDDGKTLLDRMVEAGIPFTRALQYFRNNPEGSALETLKLAAEDVIPFYGNYRNGGDVSDYAKEAVMLAMPVKKGGKYKVDEPRTAKFKNELEAKWKDERINNDDFTPYDDGVFRRLLNDRYTLHDVSDLTSKYPEFEKYRNDVIIEPSFIGEDVSNTMSNPVTYGEHRIGNQLYAYEWRGKHLDPEIRNNIVKYPELRKQLEPIMNDPTSTVERIEAAYENIVNEEALNALAGDDAMTNMAMFRLNPNVQLDMMKKLSTKRAIREWNEAVDNMPNNPYPQKIGDPVTYDQPILNNLNDAIAKNYKFTPKTRGDGILWKEDPNIVTEAIIPEDVADAAWLHHNPQMSNYDIMFGNKARGIPSALNTNVKQLINTGNLKSKYPDVDWQYDSKGNMVAKYKTVEGDYAETGQRAKSKIANILENKFPGYKEALKTPKRKK